MPQILVNPNQRWCGCEAVSLTTERDSTCGWTQSITQFVKSFAEIAKM
jgi:hypothetical protein